jgi:hypothetical protein
MLVPPGPIGGWALRSEVRKTTVVGPKDEHLTVHPPPPLSIYMAPAEPCPDQSRPPKLSLTLTKIRNSAHAHHQTSPAFALTRS